MREAGDDPLCENANALLLQLLNPAWKGRSTVEQPQIMGYCTLKSGTATHNKCLWAFEVEVLTNIQGSGALWARGVADHSGSCESATSS